MDFEDFIEQERELLGNWPNEPNELYGNQQYFNLAGEMIKSIRDRSINDGATLEDYRTRITEAQEILDNLQECLNIEYRMTEKQKEDYSEQTFWLHKSAYEGGLYLKDYEQDVWPIDKIGLIAETKRYLNNPFMWTDSLDYLITDALMYVEIKEFRESIFESELAEKYFLGRAIFFKITFFLIKWTAMIFALVVSYQESREVFLLIGMSIIAYQSVKAIKTTPSIILEKIEEKEKRRKLYFAMCDTYFECNESCYSASAIWDSCMKMRDKGAAYLGVMYDLLQKQMKKYN